MDAPTHKITFRRGGDAFDATIVLLDGERLGFVRCVDRQWWATDTYLVGLRRPFKTRGNAVKALLRRHTFARI